MADSFPQRGQVSFVPQADLISLHKTHICKGEKIISEHPQQQKPTGLSYIPGHCSSLNADVIHQVQKPDKTRS